MFCLISYRWIYFLNLLYQIDVGGGGIMGNCNNKLVKGCMCIHFQHTVNNIGYRSLKYWVSIPQILGIEDTKDTAHINAIWCVLHHGHLNTT